jgi:FkbM family methyltransferase
MKIYYGIVRYKIDVTNICFDKLTSDGVIVIPSGDNNRANFFTDPLIGVHKSIIIVDDNGTVTEYNENVYIEINMANNRINYRDDTLVNQRLAKIHSNLNINYGILDDEVPEQKMSLRYLTGNEKVLEIGGNIGRNSLVIASILKDSSNLVTLESDRNIANQLIHNRDLNRLNFHIECAALSKRRLIQRGWETTPSDVLFEGFNWVDTINLDELKAKYNIEFDTLVLDCEGAFYYILMDMPEILTNINVIIMENDYLDLSHKKYIDDILTKNNFVRDYIEGGGWGPCRNYFFETWKRYPDNMLTN